MDKSQPTVSIVFRALNEEKWFDQALAACKAQRFDGDLEIILVDSGSTDRTLDIAERHGCQVVNIPRKRFTFGRSLNWGCEAASGEYLVFISAHCIPAHDRWLANLIDPLRAGVADYVYGRQLGHTCTHFSENQIFAKYFPPYDRLPQEDFFVNNANSAIKRSLWANYRFDEECTGLEDMVLGQQIVRDGKAIGYVADAGVHHIHEETLKQTYRRYYRESLTLRDIMPDVNVRLRDTLRYVTVAITHDFATAIAQRRFINELKNIVTFRAMQFYGSYQGHRSRSRLSDAQREAYYYPKVPRLNDASQAQRAPHFSFEKGK